jgi:RNA polymerase sigma factor (sigma-70 family)
MTGAMNPNDHENPVNDPKDPPHGAEGEAAFRALLAHPRLREFLTGRLLEAGLQEADREDLEGQALEALWRRRLDADPPDNLPRLIALAEEVLKGKLVDFYRRRDVEAGRIQPPPRTPREDGRKGHAKGKDQPDFVDTVTPLHQPNAEEACQVEEQMTFVRALLEEEKITPDDLEVMQAEHAGEATLKQLAEERGLSPAALRKRVSRLRQQIAKQWKVHSTKMLLTVIFVVLLVVTIAIALGRRNPPPPAPHPDRTEERTTRGKGEDPEMLTPVAHPDGVGAKPPL